MEFVGYRWIITPTYLRYCFLTDWTVSPAIAQHAETNRRHTVFRVGQWFTAMHARNSRDDGQAEPMVADGVAARWVGSVEAIKKAWKVFWSNGATEIDDLQAHPTVQFLDFYTNRSLWLRIPCRI